MNKKIKQIISYLLIVITLNQCSSEQKYESVATVGDHFISTEEFQLTYQFNPYLIQIKDPIVAKRILLRTLIAQKMIAAEGYEKHIENNPQISRLIEQYQREALIESFWEEKISAQVHVSEKEVYDAYLKSKKTRFFQYILFPDAQNASNAYNQLKEGTSFSQMAELNGIDKDMIPSDSISFSSELIDMEKTVFQLALNEVCPPLKIGQYYFIIKLLKEKSDLFTSETDFSNNYKRLAKILKKRKQRKYFDTFIKSSFDKPPYRLDQALFKQTVQYIEEKVEFNHSSSKQTRDLSNERIYQEAIKNPGNFQHTPVVNFENGYQWTIQMLLNRLQVSPYPIEFSSPGTFRMSMIAATKMSLDDQVLVDLAIENGLEQSLNVSLQTTMWKDHIVYQSMLNDLLTEQDLSDGLIKEISSGRYEKQIDHYLTNIVEKYEIKVYSDILDTLTLSKTDMVVMKTHFPKRTLAPAIQPFLNLPKFDKLLSSQID